MTRLILALMLFSALISRVAGAPDSLIPVINGADFEQGGAGWSWSATGGVEATIRAETKDPHSGSGCLAFSNTTGVMPGVYARLLHRVAQGCGPQLLRQPADPPNIDERSDRRGNYRRREQGLQEVSRGEARREPV